VNGHDVIVVADGCGGMDHGQYASCVAASAAAAHLMILYGREPKCVPEPLAGAASAVRAASCQLAVEADKIGISDFSGGMRTTLIVIVASRTDVGYAYIGDGGACVVRTSGEIVSFLEPQKADGMANVLAGSLGPDIQGHPITGCFPRRAGDLVLAGTDGVFDRVQEMFPADVVRLAAEKRGDLTQVAQAILSELATAKDNLGYICDDNMTLALLGDGRGQVAV
jgi:serine/threonine protein phosphatase PrpC